MSAPVRRYARFYYGEFIRDYPQVYGDDAAFASFMRLLSTAEAMYPASPELPRSVRPKGLRALVEAGLVTVTGVHYTMKGFKAERTQRSQSASQNATLRWERSKVEGGRPASRRTRFKVLERDGYRCRYCGRSADDIAIDVDHIVPVRLGGTDDLDNLVAACVDCNAGKSAHELRANGQTDARAMQREKRRGEEEEKAERGARATNGRAPSGVVQP